MQFFKAVSFYTLQNLPTFAELEESLQTRQFVPATPTQEASSGFMPPRGEEHGAMLESVSGWWHGSFFIERRSVPTAEVSKEVNKEIKRIKDEEGRTVGRKEKRTLKDEAIKTLLPRAFSRTSRIDFAIDPARGLIAMDTTSQGSLDVFMSELVTAAKSLAAGNITPAYGSAGTLSQWLLSQQPPEKFSLGRACQLDSIDTKAKVAYRHISLDTDGLRDQIRAGMAVDWVRVTYDDRMSFDLDSTMRLSSLELLDVTSSKEPADDKDDGGVDAFNTNCTIFTGELGRMLPDLFAAFGLNERGTDPKHGAFLTAFGSDAKRPEEVQS